MQARRISLLLLVSLFMLPLAGCGDSGDRTYSEEELREEALHAEPAGEVEPVGEVEPHGEVEPVGEVEPKGEVEPAGEVDPRARLSRQEK